MQDNEREEQIDLTNRKLKFSEFILGILVGLVISILVEGFIGIYPLNLTNFKYWFSGSIFLFLLLFIWYGRIIKFPDFVEYSCKFLKNDNWEWNGFKNNFRDILQSNIKKQKYIGLSIYAWAGERIISKIRKFERWHIARTRFSLVIRAYLDLYKEEQKFVFLINIPILGSAEGIVEALKDSFRDLERKGIIKEGWTFTNPEYYHTSLFYPIKKKGKKIK